MCPPRTVAAGNCPQARAAQARIAKANEIKVKKMKAETNEVTYNGVRYFRDKKVESDTWWNQRRYWKNIKSIR